MSNWLIAIGVALLVGGVATFYFHAIQMRRDETRAGISALSALSWRSFIHMVLDALARRGFRRLVDDDNAAGDTEYILERDGEHWLLSCKHGSAFVLGRLALNELAKTIDLNGAAGGFLLTQGKITDEVRPFAASHRIELLDGPALWPELRDLMPEQQRNEIRTQAAATARRHSLIAWLLALVVGLGVFLALPSPPVALPPAEVVTVPPTTAPADTAPAASTPPAEAVDAAAPAPAAPMGIDEQRAALAAAVATLPDVDRALWSSESTLQVVLSVIDGDAFTRICPVVERYEQLAASRIQLTPPSGSTASVRFRQCRLY